MTYIAPEYESEKFTCPHCQAIAHQNWEKVEISNNGCINAYNHHKFFGAGANDTTNNTLRYYAGTSQCACCAKWCFWFDGKMISPANVAGVPPCHQDMPEQCQDLYDEAKNIFNQSPRSAIVLLRLCTEQLVQVLTGKEVKNLNDSIKNLVKSGLPEQIKKAIDTCRIAGNDAAHLNEISDENAEIAGQLFDTLNFIVEEQITRPKKLDSFAQKVITPEKQESIDKRDK